MAAPTEPTPKRPATVTAAGAIIVAAAGLGACQVLALFLIDLVWSSPDSGPTRERELVPFGILLVLLVGLVAFASIALEEPAGWSRVGVRVVSGVLVAGAVVTQRLTGWAVGPFAAAVVVIAVPNLLLLTPSANAYFRRTHA